MVGKCQKVNVRIHKKLFRIFTVPFFHLMFSGPKFKVNAAAELTKIETHGKCSEIFLRFRNLANGIQAMEFLIIKFDTISECYGFATLKSDDLQMFALEVLN